MDSSQKEHESLLEKKESLLKDLCRLFEQSILALTENDLDSVSVKGEKTASLIDSILLIDSELGSKESTKRIDGLVERSKGLHRRIMSLLSEGRDEIGQKIKETKKALKALKHYRPAMKTTGTRIDLMDSDSHRH